jgi:predicted RNA binding protein YcfA (HicA-like mRNA interferase family)
MRGGLKVLTGREVVKIFETFGFEVIGGTKHIKMRRLRLGGVATLIVANHSPIGKGLLRTIFMQASAYIPQEELRTLFYNE